jgi:hypothetical protein
VNTAASKISSRYALSGRALYGVTGRRYQNRRGFGGFLLKMVAQERGVHAADPGEPAEHAYRERHVLFHGFRPAGRQGLHLPPQAQRGKRIPCQHPLPQQVTELTDDRLSHPGRLHRPIRS